MDTLSNLRQQDSRQNTGRYGAEKLSALLPQMQTGVFDRSKGFTNNGHQRASRIDAEPMNL